MILICGHLQAFAVQSELRFFTNKKFYKLNGQGEIRTHEDRSQGFYRPPTLTTCIPTRIQGSKYNYALPSKQTTKYARCIGLEPMILTVKLKLLYESLFITFIKIEKKKRKSRPGSSNNINSQVNFLFTALQM